MTAPDELPASRGQTKAQRRLLVVVADAALIASFLAVLVGLALSKDPSGRSPWEEAGGLVVAAGVATVAAVVGGPLVLRRSGSPGRVLGALALALLALALDLLLALWAYPFET